MKEDSVKSKKLQQPVESHTTAAWANIKTKKNLSNVNIPNETQVRNAKEFVDSNQK